MWTETDAVACIMIQKTCNKTAIVLGKKQKHKNRSQIRLNIYRNGCGFSGKCRETAFTGCVNDNH